MIPRRVLRPDISGIGRAFTRVRVAFPDFHATVEDLVSEGDRVAYRWTFRGTHLGDFGVFPHRPGGYLVGDRHRAFR